VVGVSDTASSTPRSRSEIVAEIQRELARRGFYSGNVDGVHGPRTDAALRDFAQAAQLRLDPEPTESVLQRIVESGASRSRQEGPAPPNRGRRDPIADLLEPQPRIVAVQRALADFGYGQIKPTGVIGPETVAAIEKFERSRQLPVTGRLSERLLRELAAVTGRPLTD
jgi:peptidoglycan hydrolase-like protein with peptidoglycan-binding domain